MDFTKHVTNRKETPQNKKVPGVKKQKRNNAGGVSFKISKWDYLMRFLILGTEGGTYYASERKLTTDACDNVQKCIDKDGKRAVDIITEISCAGRSANNDAAIFALAMAASCSSDSTRKYALSKLSSVCRIGTHLFHFVAFIKTMRGFGRGLREALAHWYTAKPIDKLAYQMLKYQGRDGWTHRDVIRLAHPEPANKQMNRLFAYAVGKRDTIPKVSDYAIGMRKIKHVKRPGHAAELIREYRLTREALSTNLLNEVSVWEALLENMPMGALVRNLGKMASMDMHKSFSDTVKLTVSKLTDTEAIERSRIHPLAIMNAMLIYQNGCGFKGNLSWNSSSKIIEALEDAFYKSFKAVEPTGKNIMLALDVSGSMIARLNMSMLSCRVASAVLAMVTMRTEQNTGIIGFTGECRNMYHNGRRGRMGPCVVSELPVSPSQRMDDVVRSISNLSFGSTDCALPMLYCMDRNIDVDAIVIYTDNDTWVGDIHPWQALDKYEQKVGHKVKLIVVGMTATRFSIAKPDYVNMLDVVGMDTNTPSAISEFIKG